MSDHDEFGSFLVGFIVGGVTGAIAALLLAPQTGEETRAVIRDRSIELKDAVTEEAGKARVKIEQGVVKARAKVEETSKAVYAHGEDLLEVAKTKVKRVRPDAASDEVEIPAE